MRRQYRDPAAGCLPPRPSGRLTELVGIRAQLEAGRVLPRWIRTALTPVQLASRVVTESPAANDHAFVIVSLVAAHAVARPSIAPLELVLLDAGHMASVGSIGDKTLPQSPMGQGQDTERFDEGRHREGHKHRSIKALGTKMKKK